LKKVWGFRRKDPSSNQSADEEILKLHLSENITSLNSYPCGKSPAALIRDSGVDNPVTLALNENPWGPSPAVIKALSEAMTTLHRYPDTEGYSLAGRLAQKTGVVPGEIVLGNGSNEIIELIVRVFVKPGSEVITSYPSFLVYPRFVQVCGGENIVVPLRRLSHDLRQILACITEKTQLIILDNPNNPSGMAINPGDLYSFLSEIPETVIVILDEAYVEYLDHQKQVDIFSLIRNTKNRCGVVVVRTFSKAYGLAGLRIGYGIMPEEIAVCLHKVRLPYNVNCLAQTAALAALEDQDYLSQAVEKTRKGKDFLREEVKKLGCTSYPSQTNYLLIDAKIDSTKLSRAMLNLGVIVRDMNLYGLSDCIRINVGTDEENNRFLAVLAECLMDLEDE
jgi:histidinol-phosphate aminotransferase